jgi:hypothetical protein
MALLGAATFAAPIPARSQEALDSALSVDNVIEAYQTAPAEIPPHQLSLGPVRVALGAYGGVAYDNNVNLTQNNPQSDVIFNTGLNIGFDWPITLRSSLQSQVNIGYLHYVNNTIDGGLQIQPNSALAYSVSVGDVVITLFDQLAYIREVVSQGSLANTGTLPRLENTVGTRVAWNPDHWTLQAGYSHYDFVSEEASNDYLNRASEYFFGRVGWRFAEATEAGAEISSSLTRYQLDIQSDNQSVSLGGYFDWQLRQPLHLTFRAGPTFYNFESTPTQAAFTLNTYYLSLIFSHQLTDFFSYRIDLERNVQPGINLGSDYVEQFSATPSFGWALTRDLSWSMSLTYEKGRQPLPTTLPGGILVETIENYDRYGFGTSVSYHFTGHLSVALTDGYWHRISNLPGRGYYENMVGGTLTYAF